MTPPPRRAIWTARPKRTKPPGPRRAVRSCFTDSGFRGRLLGGGLARGGLLRRRLLRGRRLPGGRCLGGRLLAGHLRPDLGRGLGGRRRARAPDRKAGVEGQRVAGRVDTGGSRTVNK